MRFFLISWGLLALLAAVICIGLGIYRYSSELDASETALRRAAESRQLKEESRGMAALSFDENGRLCGTEQQHMSIGDDTIKEIAERVAGAGEGGGVVELNGMRYRYRTVFVRGGAWTAVTECSQELSVLHSIRYRLPLFGVIGVLLLLPVCLLISHWASKPIEEAWEKQNNFVSDATHELKTPLAVIAADTEAVLANPEAPIESQGKWLSSIRSETERMSGLVGDLLFLAKIDAGEICPETERLAISEYLEGYCMEREAEIFEKERILDYEVTPSLLYIGDRKRIRQMLDALMDNAVHYTPAGGTIRVTVNRDRKLRLRIEIANTGEPISRGDLEKIFDRFYRADPSRARETGGYGLGLCVARSIAELHGGTITAVSANGVNTFTVLLGTVPEGVVKTNKKPSKKIL